MPIRVLEVSFENSSKAKALNFAVGEIGPDGAEAVAILDADNLAGREFIARMNDALDSGIQAVQAHRTAKNRDTDTAILDAASEEINNSIFRRGHVALGFSSALIGSGMACCSGRASTSTTWTTCACWTRRYRAKVPTTTSGGAG